MPPTDAIDQKPGRPLLWLRLAAIYFLLGGAAQVLSLGLLYAKGGGFDPEFIPQWIPVVGFGVAFCRIIGGLLLLMQNARAVAFCGIVVGVGAAATLIWPSVLGKQLLGGMVWTLPEVGALIESLLSVWIWWAAHEWRARGYLRNAKSPSSLRPAGQWPTPIAIIILTYLVAHAVGSAFHFPLLIEAVRIGQLNPAVSLLFIAGSSLLAAGGLLLWRRHRSSRHVLLAAIFPWVALLPYPHVLVYSGLLIGASAFLVAVRKHRQELLVQGQGTQTAPKVQGN